jgi:TetR/AcrR family transcriptional regulator, transcriptional repressor for nem operon
MRSAPATDRGRATVERILDAACELFHTQGVRATGLDRIAKESRTGKGQIYHFFTGKPDLVLAVVERQTERVLAAQQPYLRDMATAADLAAWADHLIALHAAGDGPVRCPLGALAAELTDGEPALRAALEAAFTRWRDAIAEGLAALTRRGDLDPASDVGALAETLLGAYQAGVLLSQVHGGTGSLRLLLHGAVTQVLGAGRAPAFP